MRTYGFVLTVFFLSVQIELLSPKQNGNTSVEADSGKHNKATIKGMWKKAFKSLKSKDREKDEKTEKPDKADSKYSKLVSGGFAEYTRTYK